MSSFSVDDVTAEFDVTESGYSDKGGPLEELVCKLVVYDDTSWGALFSLRSWNVNVRPKPKRVGVASSVLVQVGGGAGEGGLSIDGFSGGDKTAVMTDLSSDSSEVGGGRRVASASWLITS